MKEHPNLYFRLPPLKKGDDMREIKFRVWDIETKQFFHWRLYEGYPTCLTKDYLYGNTQQFVGLVDKKGHEIYEGDVVLWNGFTYIIKWVRCGFDMSNTNPRIANLAGLCVRQEGQIEVIGNIYQNPELLKEG